MLFTWILRNGFLDEKVDELDKAIAVAERDPAKYGIDTAEIDQRKKWTTSTRNQVFPMKIMNLFCD
jgi:hypothetical protein